MAFELVTELRAEPHNPAAVYVEGWAGARSAGIADSPPEPSASMLVMRR